MLYINLAHLHQIENHALNTYPEECCGLLLGVNKQVKQVWETQNTWSREMFTHIPEAVTPEASKLNRFSIAPQTLLQVQKTARQLQLEIIGIYHSHPEHSAHPSECDRAIAHPGYSYVIISLQQQQPQAILSWVLDKQDQFQPEEIITI